MFEMYVYLCTQRELQEAYIQTFYLCQSQTKAVRRRRAIFQKTKKKKESAKILAHPGSQTEQS